MSKYEPGDYIKFEVEEGRESEWMWLLVESSDDEQEIVLGKLDSQPVVATDIESRAGNSPVSYEKVRDHRRFPLLKALP